MTSPCELLYAASAIWAGLSSWRTIAVLAATVLLAFAASATATTRTYTAQHSGSYSLKSESSDGLGDFSKLNQTFTWRLSRSSEKFRSEERRGGKESRY